ncbi:MAG TPA: hypothetical protein VM925_20560 [Labilithrix sp.]|nr:hypothetical protein [Labilithrix sp.]
MIVGLVLIGCSSSDDAEEPTAVPLGQAPADNKASEDERPDFKPTFDSEKDAGGVDPEDEDPTPASSDQCIDKDDPGSAENVAKALPDTDDCDDDYKTVSGVAKGPVDVDFYKLSAIDQGVSWSEPVGCMLETDFVGETAGTEICVYARCQNSTVDAVTGCEQGTAAKSDIGMNGCCAAAPGRAVPKWDCSGITDDDSAVFFIRVKQINGKLCLPYKFRYRY